MRCKTHCPPRGGLGLGPLLAPLGALVALALAVAVLRAVVPLLLPVAAVLAVLAAAAVPVLRWSARLSVAYWPARAAVRVTVHAPRQLGAGRPGSKQTALPVGALLALEAAKVTAPVVQVTAEERIRR